MESASRLISPEAGVPLAGGLACENEINEEHRLPSQLQPEGQ
jgi:hypothetical protein